MAKIDLCGGFGLDLLSAVVWTYTNTHRYRNGTDHLVAIADYVQRGWLSTASNTASTTANYVCSTHMISWRSWFISASRCSRSRFLAIQLQALSSSSEYSLFPV